MRRQSHFSFLVLDFRQNANFHTWRAVRVIKQVTFFSSLKACSLSQSQVSGEHVVLEVIEDLIMVHPEFCFEMRRHFAHQETFCSCLCVHMHKHEHMCVFNMHFNIQYHSGRYCLAAVA